MGMFFKTECSGKCCPIIEHRPLSRVEQTPGVLQPIMWGFVSASTISILLSEHVKTSPKEEKCSTVMVSMCRGNTDC